MGARTKVWACAVVMSLAVVPAAQITAQQATAQKAAEVKALPYFTEPAMAPDRGEIAFVSGGDIWTAAASGGEAHLLIAHAAEDGRPRYSPDGKRLAFYSTRTGNGDIYVYTFATGDVQRLTYDDGNDQLDGWSRDGKWIYFSSTSRDIAGMNDIFRVSADGGTPMQVTADRFTNEFFSAPSPDGKSLAFTARGNAIGQWWRKGSSHLDESEIWVMREGATAQYERVTPRGARELWPMWSADGRSLYYVSDRGGAQNVWVKPMGGESRKLTNFTGGRVVWPTISWDGKTILFEHDFEVWKMDTGNGRASAVPLTRRSAPAAPVAERLTLTTGIQEMALSPDGRKVAFAVRGDVYAVSARDGGDAFRVTRTVEAESQVAWSPDSKQIVYVSNREGTPRLYQYDFTSSAETRLTASEKDDARPEYSPDGTMVAFLRDARELRVMDLAGKQERVVATGYLGRPPFAAGRPFAWSPDNKWIAYFDTKEKQFSNVFVVAATGGESKQVSFLPNVDSDSVTWSMDGTHLLFATSQRTEDGRVVRVDLIPRAPKFREDLFRELFQEPRAPRGGPGKAGEAGQAGGQPARPPVKPVEIVVEGIRRRVSTIPVAVDAGAITVSPDGKTLLLIANAGGQQNLFTYSLDELSREPAVARQLTSTAGQKSEAQFTPDGREVYYLSQGQIRAVPLESRQVRTIAVFAEKNVDFDREKMAVFEQAWGLQRDNFYDSKFHGADWNAVHAAYAPRIAGARTPEEMRRLLSLMVGELNASHLGVTSPGQGVNETGKLGLRFDRSEYESAGRMRVTEVIVLGPSALSGQVKVGDYLLAVDGTAVGVRTNLDEVMNGKTTRRVTLTVATSADGSEKREVAVQPVSTGAEKMLLYRQWVEANREYVNRVSNGRLGYVHMPNMGAPALEQFYLDLDTENQAKDGVLIDIRNNNGGFVNVYAIDVLARRSYLGMTPRGFDKGPAPARTALGQRALELPTILLVNQHSLSDAEDFTEGYRALKLGKVVGEPTSGWIIYTSNVTLLDGTAFRIPFIRITGNDGKDMERNPRPVDIPVTRPIGETYTGKDSQIDTAVSELLKQIGPRK